MIKEYPKLSLKLTAAAILLIVSISAVVFLYKDSQKRSLLYSRAYSSNTSSSSDADQNGYPSIGKADNQRHNSDNSYPSFKGSNNNTDYTPTETELPTITSSSPGAAANSANSSSTSNANSAIGMPQGVSNSNAMGQTQHYSGSHASSNLAAGSIFAENNGTGVEPAGNGRMLVGDPPELHPLEMEPIFYSSWEPFMQS